MRVPSVLFVNHTSTVSGAEKVLLDVVAGYAESAAFLFETGALNERIAARGTRVMASRTGGGLSALTRSASPLAAIPLTGRLGTLMVELAVAARRHDVIYANSQKAFVLGALVSAISRKPLIWHLHDIITAEHFGPSQRRLQMMLANRYCRAVIAPSRAVADAFVRAGGDAGLCRVVANGVAVSADPRTRAELRRELRLPAGALIGVFSRLAPWKGQHVVVRGLAQLPGVHCILAGSSLFHDDGYEHGLRTLADELGVTDRVRFLGQRSDVAALMQAVDIVVHPSVSPEPFALTLLEAMQLKVPVIATDNGGSPAALDDGRAGTLVPAADDAALCAAIRDVLEHPDETARRVDYAHFRAKSCYGVARMRQEINAVIASVARESRSC